MAVCRHGSEGGCEGVSGDREDDGSLCGDHDTHLVWREEEAEITDQTRLHLHCHSGVYKYIMWCQSVQLQTVVSAVGPFTCKCSLVPRAWSLVGRGGGRRSLEPGNEARPISEVYVQCTLYIYIV